MINTTQPNKTGVTYTLTGTVSVGHRMNIHPSEAYQGIESGAIRVLEAGKVGELTTESTELAYNHYGMLQELLLDIEPVENYTFVVYKYDNGEVQVLELEEFLDHTTTY